MSRIKPFIRVIAFDDGFFKPRTKSLTHLVGVVYRADNRIEGLLSTKISVDSLDSTRKIIKLLSKSRFLDQIAFILLSGINFAGFNIVDVEKLNRELGKPVIIVFRKKPNFKKIFSALEKFKDSKRRIALINKAPKVHSFNGIHFQFIGTNIVAARQVIKKCLVHSNLPEPIRLAHIIASGITSGESKR